MHVQGSPGASQEYPRSARERHERAGMARNTRECPEANERLEAVSRAQAAPSPGVPRAAQENLGTLERTGVTPSVFKINDDEPTL